MGLEQLVEEIRFEGRTKARVIREKAAADGKAILDQAQAKVAAIRAEKLKAARDEADRLLRQELSNAELEVRRRRLHLEKDLFDLSFKLARQRLAQIPAADQERNLRALLRVAAPDVRVLGRRQDEAILKSISRAPVSATLDRTGGIIIESGDGTSRVDLTYDTLLEEIRDAGLRRAAEVLFGQDVRGR